MGWFNKVLVVNDTTGDIQDITDLDKEHYESFLETMRRLNIAYNVLAREGKPVESSENGLHKHDVMKCTTCVFDKVGLLNKNCIGCGDDFVNYRSK